MGELGVLALNFVSNPGLSFLRELSSVKKSCVLELQWKGERVVVEFRFGQLRRVLIRETGIQEFYLKSLLELGVITEEIKTALKNASLPLEQALEVIKAEHFISEEFSHRFKRRFYQELLEELLLAPETSFSHLGQDSVVKLINDPSWLCLIEKSELKEPALGTFILSVYQRKKTIDFLYSLGNCVTILKGKKFSWAEKLGYECSDIPLKDLILEGFGSQTASVDELYAALGGRQIEISEADFIDSADEDLEIEENAHLTAACTSNSNSPHVLLLREGFAGIFQQVQSITEMLGMISFIAFIVLLFKGWIFIEGICLAFLELQPF